MEKKSDFIHSYMTKAEIIEEIKLRCSGIFGFISENEELFLSDDSNEIEYTLAVDKLIQWSGELNQHLNGLKGYKYVGFLSKAIKSETKRPLAPDEVENPNTPFFMQSVVLTGTLQSYPKREEIASLLRLYGADINASISKKTDIVIVGSGAGPSKMKKIKELKESGVEVRVMNEVEFLRILEEYNMK